MTLAQISELQKILNDALHAWLVVPGEFYDLDEEHDDHLKHLLLTFTALICQVVQKCRLQADYFVPRNLRPVLLDELLQG